MPERLFLTFDNHFAVPPAYAMDWLTDFRADDMRSVDPKAPIIKLGRSKEGNVTREFTMMGMSIRTETTNGIHQWVAHATARDKRGRLVSRTRIVETVAPENEKGTQHHVELWQEDLTTLSRVMMTVSKPIQVVQLRKLFAEQKKRMEEAYRAGKPATV